MLSLVIKSPNHTVADFPLSCSPTWTVADLKQHLASHYPSQPPVSSQRLIHSGKLLSDSQNVSVAICGSKSCPVDPSNKFALHLVITPNKDKPSVSISDSQIKASVVNNCNNDGNTAEVSTSNGSSDSNLSSVYIQRYQQQYEEYLRAYYCQSLWQQMISQGSFSTAFPWNTDQLVSNTDLNQIRNRVLNVEEPPAAAVEPHAGAVQPAQVVDEARDVAANNVAPALGGFLEAADVGGGDANENRDPMDFFYGLLRLTLLGALVYYYSTPEKAVLSLLLLALIYILQGNFYRRYLARLWPWAHNPDQDQRPSAPTQPIEASENGASTGPEEQGNAELVDRFVWLRTLFSVLMSCGQVLITFFSSLIPERQPLIEVN